jgi:predicted aspartyl protease
MIAGRFGEIGELFFEIEVVAADGESLPIEVLLDTGFTTGWLAMDAQDIESLGWALIYSGIVMQTARGDEVFDIYEGKVKIDRQEFTIPVVATKNIPEPLLGLQWLTTRRLVVDFLARLLTLENRM